MKKIIVIALLLQSFLFMNGQDTFSIVAIDPVTGEVGSAGASCINGSKIISYVLPGVGAIHTQAYYIFPNQNYTKNLMIAGYPPQQIIDSVVANDAQNNPTIRQYGVVDFTGAAAYTGVNCDDYKNHIVGPNYSIQGNILLGQQILDSIEARFLNTSGTLACKLMSALQGAKVPGADTRCLNYGISTLSSFIRVALPGDTLGTLSLDLNVNAVDTSGVIDPIDSLQTLFDLANGCSPLSNADLALTTSTVKVFPNPASNYVSIISSSSISNIYLIENGKEMLLVSNVRSKSYRAQTASWVAGMKILKVELENGRSEMIKLIIQ